MSPEQIIVKLQGIHAPQVALARMANLTPNVISDHLRRYGKPLSENQVREIGFVVEAMQELSDEAPYPPDWRRVERLRPMIEERVARIRAACSRQLHEQFLEQTASAQ